MDNNEILARMEGYTPNYDYTQYANDFQVNVIPGEDLNKLTIDTFRTIVDIMECTYGPYGTQVMITKGAAATPSGTKDGFATFEKISFANPYKAIIYNTIHNICDRVNRNVGDGTTSCILLAEAIYRNLYEDTKNVETRRNILKIFSELEAYLSDISRLQEDRKKGIIKPLNKESFMSAVKMAANGDEKTANLICECFDPSFNEDGSISNIRNVICDVVTDKLSAGDTTTKVMKIPGKYKVSIDMDTSIIHKEFEQDKEVKIVLYDHKMTDVDWDHLFHSWDFLDQNADPIMVIARDFTLTVKERYQAQINKLFYNIKHSTAKVLPKINVFLAKIVSNNVQTELLDLGAVLDIKPNSLVMKEDVDTEKLPMRKVRIENLNCLCFMDITEKDIPHEYINKVIDDMNASLDNSYISKCRYKKRIKALQMKEEDTILKLSGSSALEVNMESDKIDDCTCIINSAVEHGVVPNMLTYGYYRLNKFVDEAIINMQDTSKMRKSEVKYGNIKIDTLTKVRDAIVDLFRHIYGSKYGETLEYGKFAFGEEQGQGIYKNNDDFKSFDIIEEEFIDCEKLATSAQYDIEVIISAISIVKYLISTKMLIFDTGVQAGYHDVPSSYSKTE